MKLPLLGLFFGSFFFIGSLAYPDPQLKAISTMDPALTTKDRTSKSYSDDIDQMIQQADTNDPRSPLPLRKSRTQYSVQGTLAIDDANQAIVIEGRQLTTHFQQVHTGMCSSATAMVFLSEISKLQSEKKINLTPETLQALKLTGADGVGFWGRWNADGPGTALLFQEYNLGRNFEDLAEARPGDFMKIFWNDRMGEDPHARDPSQNERGHSVVFEGAVKIKGEVYVQFWSANSNDTPGFPDAKGFKMKYKKLSEIQHHIFSRLEHPENLNRIVQVTPPKTNAFLSSLLTKSYSYNEGLRASGLKF